MIRRPLNTKEKTIIDLIYIKEQPTKAVAKQLGITVERVYQIKARAITKIRLGNRPLVKCDKAIYKINLEELLK